MYSDDWDNSNLGICYHSQFTALTRSHGVCLYHRYDNEDEGDKELLFAPHELN